MKVGLREEEEKAHGKELVKPNSNRWHRSCRSLQIQESAYPDDDIDVDNVSSLGLTLRTIRVFKVNWKFSK